MKTETHSFFAWQRWARELLWMATVGAVVVAVFPYDSGAGSVSPQGAWPQPAASPARTTAQPSTQARLNDLEDLDQLRRLFQRDNGKVRLISLLSPT